MVKPEKLSKNKSFKKQKKSYLKDIKSKIKRHFSYRFRIYKRDTLKSKKDNFPSYKLSSFATTKQTVIDLEEINLEQPKPLNNNIISDIFFANYEEVDFFSYDNICKVNSNKEVRPGS